MKILLLSLLLTTLALTQDDTIVLHPYDPVLEPFPSQQALQYGQVNQAALLGASPRGPRCDPNQRWNPNTAACEPQCVQTVMCTTHQTFNNGICACVCDVVLRCPLGKHWSRNLCDCEDNHLTTSN